jgi:general secretion pathway protein C
MASVNDNPRMVSTLQSRWAVAGSTLVLWGLVAASAAYWAMKLSTGGTAVPAAVAVRTPAPADPAAVARLLGATARPAEAAPVASLASRFVLLGVVGSRGQQGAALIAVDGRPAKPFRIGASVDEGLVLQSVEGRRAVLAPDMQAAPSLVLELPAAVRR